ncbi:glycosyltransferase family 4 protein [Rhodoplanes sp. Z2-YC6860]|uniref:glycosyltransferase family 4 protein n=1 Tax=Rhodoplanes sp. Z2-YC6860 TaxID=674703 RepID=UPI00078BCDC1|nr:glycosyltransferase family 4 protein [Rhodoplanes sp. Z2-YC6860]AMN43737.1 glycosyl transferase group 1 [Rhodoplanes sp. Z2-YC6860]
MRLAIVASHPVQYYAPLFRALAQRLDLQVLYAHRATSDDQARAGFGVEFEWDTDLLSGYEYLFLRNVSTQPGVHHFFGCDTPEIRQRLSEEKFDAVMVQGWHLKCYIQTVFSAKVQGLPLLVRGDSHLNTPRTIFKRVLKAGIFPAFLRLFDGALYVGTQSRDYWIHYKYPQERLFYSPHCIDTKWFSAHATIDARREVRERLKIVPSTKVVLFAGKLVSFKRPLDVLNAVALLKARNREMEIVVAGAGVLQEEMRGVADAAGIKVHFLGFCNQTEMPKIYAASDVLVLPSDGRETWGLVANEAIACGRPVILADGVGSAKDIAGDSVAGRIFPVGNIAALAQRLDEIVQTPPALHLIEKKSNEHSISAAVAGIEAAVQSVSRGCN